MSAIPHESPLEQMHYTAMAPWFGSNRTLGHAVGEECAGATWVGVGCVGGGSELAHLTFARSIVVNDVHGGMMNLLRAAAHPVLGPQLYRRLRRKQHGEGFLDDAKRAARLFAQADDRAAAAGGATLARWDDAPPSLEWAESYFATIWMSRNGNAGTYRELEGGLSMRLDGDGGDSAGRYHRMVRTLPVWRRLVLSRCTFIRRDVKHFLQDVLKGEVRSVRGKRKVVTGRVVYLDPPFPGPGDRYKHTFTEEDHRDVAKLVGAMRHTRVVLRYYVHPLIEELYPRDRWTWRLLEGERTQHNNDRPGVLIINGPSYAKPADQPTLLVRSVQQGNLFGGIHGGTA